MLEFLLCLLFFKNICILSIGFFFYLDLPVEISSSWCSKSFWFFSLFFLEYSFLCLDLFLPDQPWSSLSFNKSLILLLFFGSIDSFLDKFILCLLKFSILDDLISPKLLILSPSVCFSKLSRFEFLCLC